MRAVILAGGKGSRLGAVSRYLPKPLVPVGDMAVVDILLRQMAAAGCGHATLAVGHRASLIMAYLQNGMSKMRVDYSRERSPLGTMGPLRLIDLPENFLVVNGDVLTDLDFAAFFRGHVESGAMATVAVSSREVVDDFGVIEADGNRIVGFREKPRQTRLVSMGVYALSRAARETIPRGEPYGFDDLMRGLLACDGDVRAFLHSGYWMDIGRPDDYDRANREFESVRDRLLPDIRGR